MHSRSFAFTFKSMATPNLTTAQETMLLRGDHHRVDVARSAAACSAWHRTRDALVRKGLAEKRWPVHPAGGVSFRLVLTPEGHAAREQLQLQRSAP